MTPYQYLCHERPPVPGAIPKNGLAEVKDPPPDVSTITINGTVYNFYGYAIYNRPLTVKEVSDYELLFVATRHVYVPN